MTQRSSTPGERKAVGARLRDTAKAAGLTSDEIAEKLGVQGGSVRGWWVGRNEPSFTRLRKYAELVGVSTGYLLFGVDREMGPSGTLQEWRLRFAELIARGVNPLEALDQITGSPHWNQTGIPDDRLTPEERTLLGDPAAGDAMRSALSEATADSWERLTEDQKSAVLHLIETMARSPRDEPG